MRASAKPSPTSTPLTAWIPISARGEAGVEPRLPARVRAEARRDAARPGLDHAADGVALRARRVHVAQLQHAPLTEMPSSRRNAFATAPAATSEAVWRALARSRASRTSSRPYFCAPARSAWPGRGSVTGFVPFPVRLALGRPRAHPPRPVLVVAVAHDEGERGPERAPVAQPGEHLDLVALDPLARAAAVALLAAVEVGVDRLSVEHEPGREAGQDRNERGPVRLAGGRELERHAPKPTALRITSTGAGTPVQRSNEAAPWATSDLEAADHRRACPARGSRGVRVRIRQVDQRLSGAEAD